MAAYTTIDDPSAYFKVSLHTGNNTNDHAITFDDTDTTMQPDLVWIKSRDNTEEHMLTDSVRPINNYLSSDNAGAEDVDSDNMQSLDSNGFTMGVRGSHNANTIKYVAWCWKESATSGFDIVSYTGNDTARTISHSLSAVPHFIFATNRTGANNEIYHHVGIYSFRYETLKKFISIPPSKNEIKRKLEQLRALDAGMTIGVSYVKDVPISVDTKKDLLKVENIIKNL